MSERYGCGICIENDGKSEPFTCVHCVEEHVKDVHFHRAKPTDHLISVVEAHDAAALAMSDAEFALHQTDCGMCEDFGRPTSDLHLIHTRLIPGDEGIVRALLIEAENKVAEIDKALRRKRKARPA